MVPILLGVAPFGLIAGATAVEAGFSPLLATAMSVIVFAGAAQLAVIGLVDQGATPVVIVVTAVVINLRYLMYSASIAPYVRSFARLWRPVLTYLLTDQAFAVAITRYEGEDPIAGEHDDPVARQWYYFGAAATLWLAWQVATILGVLVGARVPPAWSSFLEFGVPLTFLALLFGHVENRATTATAVVAGVVATVGVALPLNLGLIVGAVVGIAAGLLVEWGGGR